MEQVRAQVERCATSRKRGPTPRGCRPSPTSVRRPIYPVERSVQSEIFAFSTSLVAMSSSTIGKKRKRGADDAEKTTLRLTSQPAEQVGPVLGK